ncbi:ATP-binding protein [Geodermatophilus sp. SYSU D00758]
MTAGGTGGSVAAPRSGAGFGVEQVQRVVELVHAGCQAAEQVSVTLARDERLETVAAAGRLARQVDAAQYAAGEGPCVTAARTGAVVVVADLAGESRWPRFARRMAAERRVRSMASLPLRVDEHLIGALNLASSANGAFTEPGEAEVRSGLTATAGLALAAVAAERRAAEATARAIGAADFLAGLAHDLRSGMTVLLSAGELLDSQRPVLDAQGREALDLLGDELRRQRWLVTELLELARADTGFPRRLPIGLLPAVSETLARYRRPVPVQVDPAAADVHVGIHPIRLGRVLANLLDNAERHAGGATAVRVERSGDSARVVVEDAGPGVPAGRREQIFTRFGRGPAPAGDAGAHLGLALSREHARRAGGDLLVEDRDGGGARFLLVLPVRAPRPPRPQEPVVTEGPGRTDTGRSPGCRPV